MKTRSLILTVSMVIVAAAVSQGGSVSFDKLNDADRKVFRERFEKEVWPLLSRGGKDGCVGCHSGKVVSALHFSGDSGKDFHFLLKEGFFLPNDAGSLLSRILDKDPERRMPKGKSPWAAQDAAVLKAFMADLDKKQQKK